MGHFVDCMNANDGAVAVSESKSKPADSTGSDSAITDAYQNRIPDDLKDSLCVLLQWEMFINAGKRDGGPSRIETLTSRLEQRRADFFSHVRDNLALGEIATKLSNKKWTIKNGNFFCDDFIDMGCPLVCTYVNNNPQFLMPLMDSYGAFDPYHAHILPALMINKLLLLVSSFEKNKVLTYVLCHGNGITERENWWNSVIQGTNDLTSRSKRVVNLIFACKAFRSIFNKIRFLPKSGKSVKRLCIWIGMPGHVFIIVWEITFKPAAMFSSVCFAVDNLAKNEFRDTVVTDFVSELNINKIKTTALGLSTSFISSSDIGIAEDMKCVSFMARATLYFSMVNGVNDHWMVREFHNKVGIEQERNAFKLFTEALLEFIKQVSEERKMVWISPICDTFVNINSIYLMKVDPSNAHLKSDQDKFVYQGVKDGFVQFQTISKYTCGLSSKFTSSVPMQLKSSICPLTIINECRLILEKLLLRAEDKHKL